MVSKNKNANIISLGTTFLIILAISFVLIEGQIKPACSTSLTPDHVYLFYSTGCIDSDKTKNYDLEMTLITKNNSDSKFVMHEKDGTAQFFDTYYTLDNDWQITTLNNQTLLLMYGNATDYNDDKISIHILGKMINDTVSGPVYLISGKVSGKNGDSAFNDIVEMLDLKFLNESKSHLPTPVKIINNLVMPLSNNSQNKSVSKNKNSEPISLLAKSYDRAYIEYSYSFTAKIYYADKNPSFDFDQHGGEVQNANVTANIVDWNGNIIKSFTGMTNKFGYFSDSYLIPDDFIPGTYAVIITAEKDGSIDTNDYVLNVFKRNLAGAPPVVIDPDAPTGLTAITKSKKSISLSWDAPDNPSETITGYKIERNSLEDGGWVVIIPDTGKVKTFLDDKKLTSGTQYTYRVSTNFNDHTSRPSNEASATTS